ncbi:MAG: hypothetical protein H7345_06045 [Rubritepida sp.]|nr:hypothetical protein [Rubritepida sp.]
MQSPEAAPRPTPPPGRTKGFALGLVAVVAALILGQYLIEALALPSNFIVSLIVFIVLDIIFMFALNRIFGR